MGIATVFLASPASAAPVVIDYQPAAGATVDKADGTPTIQGSVNLDTASVLVAIRNNGSNRWWHQGTCGGSQLGCAAGILQNSWSRSEAVLTADGNRFSFSFPADLPPGSYNVGIRPVAANGNVLPGPWYRFTVVNTVTVAPANGSPAANETVNQGLVTITHGQDGSAFDGCCFGTSRVAVKRLGTNEWLQDDRTWGPSYNLFNMDVNAVGLFGAEASFAFDADQPGRYGYWIENYNEFGAKSSQGWAAFNVAACSVRCANIENSGGVGVGPDGVCFSGSLRDPSPRFTVLQASTGQWLQGNNLDPLNPTFGAWNWFNNLSSLIQADTDLSSCFNEPALVLPSGNYFVGIRVYDDAGQEGPAKWIPITIN